MQVNNEYLRATVRQRLQLIPRDYLPKYLALLITALHVIREPRVLVFEQQLEIDGEAGHVERERTVWLPRGVEVNYFISNVITNANRLLHH